MTCISVDWCSDEAFKLESSIRQYFASLVVMILGLSKGGLLLRLLFFGGLLHAAQREKNRARQEVSAGYCEKQMHWQNVDHPNLAP